MGGKTSKEREEEEAERERREEEERRRREGDRAARMNSVMPKVLGGMTEILNKGDIMWLNMRLPTTPRPAVWSAAYLSHRDGKSFTKLVHSIRKAGRSLIIVRDDGGHVFGLYAGDDWLDATDREEEFRREKAHKAREERMGRSYDSPKSSADTNFYGSGDCALLAIRPEQKLYRPTKMNENYMYLQTTWPEPELNGLAMGGLPSLFGVHLDAYLDKGYFKGANGVCMTFNNPCLAHKPEFKILDVEVWILGDTHVEAREDSATSVLNKKEHKADQQIMEFAGKKFYRDEDH